MKKKEIIIMHHQNAFVHQSAFFCVLMVFAEFSIAEDPRSVPKITETADLAHIKGNLMQQFGF